MYLRLQVQIPVEKCGYLREIPARNCAFFQSYLANLPQYFRKEEVRDGSEK